MLIKKDTHATQPSSGVARIDGDAAAHPPQHRRRARRVDWAARVRVVLGSGSVLDSDSLSGSDSGQYSQASRCPFAPAP